MTEKTKYQKLKKIGELMAETDTDTKWEIENNTPKQLWAVAFAEGAKYIDEIYNASLKKTIDKEIDYEI